MNPISRMRSLLRGLARRKAVERDMDAELRFHIESYADDLVARGIPREEAMRQARLEFGSVEAKKEDCRTSLGLRLWDELRGDVRYTARVLAKSPGFTAIAVVTLALGIGANTAIFTLVDALLLRAAPVHRAGELYQVKRTGSGERGAVSGAFTNPLWESIRVHQDVFSDIAAWGTTRFDLSPGGAVQYAEGMWVSGDYFSMLGVQPALGRLIGPPDDVRGCRSFAVLSYTFWRDHFGASPNVVGTTISLNTHAFEVIGVTAPGFYGLDLGSRFDVAAPICSTAVMDGARSRLDVRSWWWLTIVGRLKPGIAPEQMKARLLAVSPAVFAEALPNNWDADSQKAFLRFGLTPAPAGTGVSWNLRDDYQRPLQILMGVVAMVLLIACANVAGLMLARAAAQNREMAVRLALGATRARLARQLLTHAVLLSAAGAVAGAAAAQWGTSLLVRAISTRRNPIFFDLTPDWRVAGFTAAIAIATAVVFGMLPAVRVSRATLTDAMRAGPMSQTERRSPLRKWMVASQVALSLVLLVTAGLFLRSFVKLALLDPGFNKKNVLLVGSNLRTTSIKPERQLAMFDALEASFRNVPGVIAVGRCHMIPLGGGEWDNYVIADSPHAPKGKDADSLMNAISPGYFAAMGMPLLAGRDFKDSDSKTSAPVAIVNQTLARKFYPGLDPLGRIIRVPGADSKPGPAIQIVGVVADAKYLSLREPMGPTTFFPAAQAPAGTESSVTIAVRTAARPESLIAPLEKAAAGVSGEIPLEFHTLAQQVDDAMAQERLLAMLSGFFGALALVLAMVGLYGAVSYRVTLRRTEFGIRMALGAQVAGIIRLVIREVLVVVGVGMAAGIGISLAATTALGKLLFGIGPRDSATIAGAALVLSAVALVAAFAPARRAAKVDPMVALRYE